MLGVLLALALTGPVEPDCERVRCPRVREARPDSSRRAFAFFEFAPPEGTGMTAPCACTTPTGAKGETLTFTRASSATCLKCTTTTGIENGDMVTCLTDQPRVMPGGDGTGGVGLLVEDARTNTCLRSAELCNAAWSDVGTPACSSDQAIGPFGTQTMDQLTDNDGAAFEGRSQAITTTSATQHSVSCFVKAGTATAASITLVGTGSSTGDCTGTATGLSTTTSTRVTCSSSAAYAGTLTAVTVTIRVGTVVGDQGTLFVEGCQHELSAPFASSYIATAGASATRAAEVARFSVAMSQTSGSHAVTVVPEWSTGSGSAYALLTYDSSARMAYGNADSNVRIYDGTTEVSNATTYTAGTAKRIWSSYGGASMSVNDGADTASGAFDGTMGAGALTTLSVCNGIGLFGFSVCKRVCADLSEPRCR